MKWCYIVTYCTYWRVGHMQWLELHVGLYSLHTHPHTPTHLHTPYHTHTHMHTHTHLWYCTPVCVPCVLYLNSMLQQDLFILHWVVMKLMTLMASWHSKVSGLVLSSARQETQSAYLSGIHPSKSPWEEPLSSLYGENWKVVNSWLCLPIWVGVSEKFFIAGSRCILRTYSRCQPVCHISGLTPYVEFLSSRSNYNIYLAKGPLQLLTDHMQELCTTASCLQSHASWTFDDS